MTTRSTVRSSKYADQTGARQIVPTGPDRLPGEAVSVPADGGTAENDGHLTTVNRDSSTYSSKLLVLDANGPQLSPTVHLSRRVPGIRGSWIPDPEV